MVDEVPAELSPAQVLFIISVVKKGTLTFAIVLACVGEFVCVCDGQLVFPFMHTDEWAGLNQTFLE